MKEIRKKEEKYLATLKDENTDENLTGVEKKGKHEIDGDTWWEDCIIDGQTVQSLLENILWCMVKQLARFL